MAVYFFKLSLYSSQLFSESPCFLFELIRSLLYLLSKLVLSFDVFLKLELNMFYILPEIR